MGGKDWRGEGKAEGVPEVLGGDELLAKPPRQYFVTSLCLLELTLAEKYCTLTKIFEQKRRRTLTNLKTMFSMLKKGLPKSKFKHMLKFTVL